MAFTLLLLMGAAVSAHRAVANSAATAYATNAITITDSYGTRTGNQATDPAGIETQIWDHSGDITYTKTASGGGYNYSSNFANCYYQADANMTFSNHPVTCNYKLYSYSGGTETVLYQTTPSAVTFLPVLQSQNLSAVWSSDPVRFRLEGYWIHPTRTYPHANSTFSVFGGSAWTDDL